MRRISASIHRKVIIMMGAAGSGKGTISNKIVGDFDVLHISTGDLLRKHLINHTPLGAEAEKFVTTGTLVPDDVLFRVLDHEVFLASKAPRSSLLFDGFPRTLRQAQRLQDLVSVDCVVSLEIPHPTIIDRLSSRWVHLPSGRTYSYDYKPPKVYGKDDITNEDLVQREDDKPETVRRRLQLYDVMKESLMKYYEGQGNIVVRRFSGTKSDEIYPSIKTFLSSDAEISLRSIH
jgi:nucleoside-triphosphate--adenylate kinase